MEDVGQAGMIGRTLGHYRILEQLGAGGMGVVHHARDERLERDVALEVLPAGSLGDEQARGRFRREALALAKLSHAYIGAINDFDSQGDVDFLVMEYVAGTTLADRLLHAKLPEREVLGIGSQIARALEDAHGHGVIHRDLKPGNIMVNKEAVKVLDFGLARMLDPVAAADAPTFARTEPTAGTPPYMAPEQLRGEPADARSDIHALGTVLYEMATGRRAFQETGSLLIDAIPNRTLVYAGLGMRDQVFEQLERAIEERQPYLVLLNVEPPFLARHDDSRFQQAVRRIGIPPPR